MKMASSKKNLTEQETIIEGLMDTLLQKFLMGRAKNVANLIQQDKNLARASKELKDASKNWKKALKKTIQIQKKTQGKAGRDLDKKLGI